MDHIISITVMAHIVVDKSTDNAKPHLICLNTRSAENFVRSRVRNFWGHEHEHIIGNIFCVLDFFMGKDLILS